jgi:hypothetical protein
MIDYRCPCCGGTKIKTTYGKGTRYVCTQCKTWTTDVKGWAVLSVGGELLQQGELIPTNKQRSLF